MLVHLGLDGAVARAAAARRLLRRRLGDCERDLLGAERRRQDARSGRGSLLARKFGQAGGQRGGVLLRRTSASPLPPRSAGDRGKRQADGRQMEAALREISAEEGGSGGVGIIILLKRLLLT